MKFAFLILIMAVAVSVSGQTLKVMTYNIRYATENDGVNAWSKRKGKVFDLLRRHDPAIIGLQEALQGQIKDILSEVKGYDFIGVGRDDGKAAGEYSPLLYKKKQFALLEQNTFWLSETPDVPGSKNWDAAITRVASWAKLKDKKSGRVFLVINTHFDHIGVEARRKSAELLKAKAHELAGGLPVIILGDFNCTRQDPPYSIMVREGNLRLADTAPENPPGTYCTFEVNSVECKAIDYIFYSEQWVSSEYQVISENDGKHYPSDHLPVTSELSFKK
jgi:endonuclease/exonuclease/phosphatase family metal-dependent hydrolase